MSGARDVIKRHATGADIERRLKRRGDRSEAAITLLFAVFLSVILTISVVHWLEIGSDQFSQASVTRDGGVA